MRGRSLPAGSRGWHLPKRRDIRSVCLIGAGPIVIGQACEFDYAGCQALKVLREDGFRTIVVNSNPATIMTDPGFADRTYIEPLDAESVAAVLERERPDALLPTMGGQTALNLATELAEAGVLGELGVELIGAGIDAIKRAEDRELFRETVRSTGLKVPQSTIVTSVDEIPPGLTFPVILRPAFTLGGHGGGTAHSAKDLRAKVAAKLAVGYTLDEIPNDLTQTTPASFEPTLDYVVVKFPRFAFEKFPGADSTLGTQMKSVGEAMGIGRTFTEGFLKAMRSRELQPGDGLHRLRHL